jgi:hypothetical protein
MTVFSRSAADLARRSEWETRRNSSMEAERVNAIAKQLEDLEQRSAELRRYL